MPNMMAPSGMFGGPPMGGRGMMPPPGMGMMPPGMMGGPPMGGRGMMPPPGMGMMPPGNYVIILYT